MNWPYGKFRSYWAITDYEIRFERISREQVTAEDGNREMVGISVSHENKTAFIYHTRNLNHEDIIHELVHVAYPKYTEEEVRDATADLMQMIVVNSRSH